MNDSGVRTQLEHLHARSFVWALRCCDNDRYDAEEVLQTVYLKVLEGGASFGGKSSFKTWLFAVIRNTAADLRRRRRFRVLKLNTYRDRLDLQPTIPDELSETLQIFRRQLGLLPARQQQVLELVFYHDLTLEQTAEVMGISLGSVRRHYDRGKKKMRVLLQKSGVWYE